MNITPLKKEHFSDIIKLSNIHFGQNFITSQYLNKYLSIIKKQGFTFLSDQNNVVGFILTDILNTSEFIEAIIKDKEWFISQLNDYKNVALIKQIVVNELYQNKGIGSLLIEHVINLLNTSSQITYCLAWKKGDKTPLKNILLKNGFSNIKTITNYWYNDSLSKNYSCIHCGSPPCTCSSEVYFKKNAFKI